VLESFQGRRIIAEIWGDTRQKNPAFKKRRKGGIKGQIRGGGGKHSPTEMGEEMQVKLKIELYSLKGTQGLKISHGRGAGLQG